MKAKLRHTDALRDKDPSKLKISASLVPRQEPNATVDFEKYIDDHPFTWLPLLCPHLMTSWSEFQVQSASVFGLLDGLDPFS